MQKMGVKNRTALTMRAQDRTTAILSTAPFNLPGETIPGQGTDPGTK
jgi:hypothetical protein